MMDIHNPVKKILATKELTVNINGMIYDVLLIPRDIVVEVDYAQCPEEYPVVQATIAAVRQACKRND